MIVQELQTPELQPVAMESKGALALLKYLPLQPQAVPQVKQPVFLSLLYIFLPLSCECLLSVVAVCSAAWFV